MLYDPYNAESETRTPWAVHCPHHGLVYLTEAAYDYQLMRPNDTWRCTHIVMPGEDPNDPDNQLLGPCGARATWDDDNYEAAMEELWEAQRDEAADREFDARREERDDFRGWDD